MTHALFPYKIVQKAFLELAQARIEPISTLLVLQVFLNQIFPQFLILVIAILPQVSHTTFLFALKNLKTVRCETTTIVQITLHHK